MEMEMEYLRSVEFNLKKKKKKNSTWLGVNYIIIGKSPPVT